MLYLSLKTCRHNKLDRYVKIGQLELFPTESPNGNRLVNALK